LEEGGDMHCGCGLARAVCVTLRKYVVAWSTKVWYHWEMSRNTSFSIGEHFNAFVDEQVQTGRYSSASDVMRAALRLLEEREAKLAALRAALIEGEESGPATPSDFDAFIAEMQADQPAKT
jgi:antitoxin ParD1/3/4